MSMQSKADGQGAARKPEELANDELEQVSGGALCTNEIITEFKKSGGGLKITPKPLESETEDE